MRRLYKYVISIPSYIAVLIIFAISTFCYCILNVSAVGSLIANSQVRTIIINIFLVLTSVTGTNLLTSLIIEKNSKNQEWRNIITEEILSNHVFYDYMSAQTKEAISDAVNYSINEYNNTVQQEIMQSIIRKLNFKGETYYFNKCNYFVNCEIFDDHIKYDMKRITEIYAYEERCKIFNFRVAVIANSCNNVHSNIGMEIKVNGRILSECDYLVETECSDEESDIVRNGYNTIQYIYLREPLVLHAEATGRCTTILFRQVIETTLDDVVNSYRASKPCRNFRVDFNLQSRDRYRLVSNSFGFIDSTNPDNDADVDYISKIEFSDWVFEDDGVVITIVPR